MISRSCSRCGQAFAVTDQDLSFYEKISPAINSERLLIPPPSCCYHCRQRRRLTWRNERTLYWRSCALTGKRMMSTYAPESPYTVYNFEDWFAGEFDPLLYGRDYDFSRPFFEQFDDLMKAVPLPSLFNDSTSENTNYANLSKRNKNCYFIFAGNDNEHCFYATYLQRNRDIADCFFIFDSELCYECIDCYNCYDLSYSVNCQNCASSFFLKSSIGCNHCFGCISLKNKEYHIFNKPYSKIDYQAKLSELKSDPLCREHAEARLRELSTIAPQKNYAGFNNSNISGDRISFSKNALHCFDCTHLEDCKYCTWLHRAKDCYDHYAWGLSGELGYENHLVGDGFFSVRFCEECFTGVEDLLYCRYCINQTKHCFGSIGLQHEEYCILNKRYSKEEYEALLPRIINHMRSTGEWGEFFPEKFSPYGYNESVAQEYFPLSREAVIAQGFKWRDEREQTKGKGTIAMETLPHRIEQVPEAIVNEVLTCTSCKRNYRITTEELFLYRKLDVSLPDSCFNCRYAARRSKRNPRSLWQRECSCCKTTFLTSYSPGSKELIYCEGCYLREVM